MATVSTPKLRAASSNSSAYFFGSTAEYPISKANRFASGNSSCNSCNRLGPSSHAKKLTPVMLASGLLRFATKPKSLGSLPVAKTIGMVEVAAWAARTGVSPPTVTMTSTP